MNTYCRIWEAGGQASLTTSTEGGELKAKLEIQLGSPAAPRPGAPSTTSGHPAASHRPCHRGPAAKARSRARAAAYQAKKSAAATVSSTATAAGSREASPSSASQRRPLLPASPGSGGSPSTSEDSKPLNILPSPPASDGQRLVVSVGRGERRLTSFSQLDGQDDSISPSPPSADPASAYKAMSARSLYKMSSSGVYWAANPT